MLKFVSLLFRGIELSACDWMAEERWFALVDQKSRGGLPQPAPSCCMKWKIRGRLILLQRGVACARLCEILHTVFGSLHTRQNLAVEKILGAQLVRRFPWGILGR